MLYSGELEMTIFERFCEGQNLRVCFDTDEIKSALPKIQHAFSTAFQNDRRGTLLNDMFAFESVDAIVYKNTSNSTPLPREYRDLLVRYRGTPRIGSSHYVYLQPSIQVHGMMFSPEQTSYGNSLVIYRPTSHSTDRWHAGKIISIFLQKQRSGSVIGPPFLVVRSFVPLGVDEAVHDHYRKFGDSGGRLFYDRHGGIVMLSLEDVLCHFASTPMQVAAIKGDCIHVLPLSRADMG